MDYLNTLATIRTQAPGLENSKIDSETLLRALTLKMESHVLFRLAQKQAIKRNAGTNTVQWRGYKPLPVAANRHAIVEGVNPTGMAVGARTVTGSVAVYGAYLEVSRQTETYNLDQLFVEYGPLLVDHAGETLELIVRDEVEAEAGEYFVVPAGKALDIDSITAADVLTLDACRVVANSMKVNRRLGHESTGKSRYVVVVATEAMQDLLDDEKLEKKLLIPGNTTKPIMDNGLQEYPVYNLTFIEYMFPVVEKNATLVPVYHSYVFGEGAFAVIELASAGVETKRFGFDAKSGDNLGQIGSLGWITMGFGAKVLDPIAATKIFHTVSKPLAREDVYATQPVIEETEEVEE